MPNRRKKNTPKEKPKRFGQSDAVVPVCFFQVLFDIHHPFV